MPDQNHEIKFTQGPLSQEALQAFIEPTIQSDMALGGISAAVRNSSANPEGVAAWAENTPVNQDGSRDYAPDFVISSRGETPTKDNEPDSPPQEAPEPIDDIDQRDDEPDISDEMPENTPTRPDWRTQAKQTVHHAANLPNAFAADPTRTESVIRGKVDALQGTMDYYRDSDVLADIGYKAELAKNSQDFIDNLLANVTLEGMQAKPLQLTEAGFDMIDHSLKNGRVLSLKELKALQQVIYSQGLSQLAGAEFGPDEKIDHHRTDLAQTYVRYRNGAGSVLSMYCDPNVRKNTHDRRWSTDTVAAVMDKMQTSEWKLTDSEQDYYDEVINVNRSWTDESRLKTSSAPKVFRSHKTVFNRLARKFDKPDPVYVPSKDEKFADSVMKWWKSSDVARTKGRVEYKDPSVIMQSAATDARRRISLAIEIEREEILAERDRLLLQKDQN